MTRFYREQFGRASHSVSKREVRANRFGSGHNRICRASLSLPGINNSISFFLPLSALSRQRMIFTPNSRKPHPQDREERVHSFPFDKTTRIVSFLKDSATNGIHGGILMSNAFTAILAVTSALFVSFTLCLPFTTQAEEVPGIPSTLVGRQPPENPFMAHSH